MHKSFTAFSNIKNDKEAAFSQILDQLKQHEIIPQLILFSSCNPYFNYVSQRLFECFPETQIVGCTSCYQFNSSGNNEYGISLFAVAGGIEVKAGVILEAASYPMKYFGQLEKVLKYFKSYENMCCVEFTTANSNGEELVLDTLNKGLEEKNITIFGSTAGYCSFDENNVSMVSVNGQVYENACAFVLLKNLDGKIFTYKENIYIPTKNVFTVTDVDSHNRIVYEYNGEPAAVAIARALDTEVSNLGSMLEGKPMGRCVDGDVYITETNKVNPDNSISYYSQIYNYTKIALMRTENIPEVFANTRKIVKNNISPDFMLVANCVSRKNLFEKEGLTGAFMNSLKTMSQTFWGLSGYGEQLDFVHMNQSMVLIAFE